MDILYDEIKSEWENEVKWRIKVGVRLVNEIFGVRYMSVTRELKTRLGELQQSKRKKKNNEICHSYSPRKLDKPVA